VRSPQGLCDSDTDDPQGCAARKGYATATRTTRKGAQPARACDSDTTTRKGNQREA